MPRIWNSLAVLGSPRTALMTEPPWLPVAPNTTKSFLSAIFKEEEEEDDEAEAAFVGGVASYMKRSQAGAVVVQAYFG